MLSRSRNIRLRERRCRVIAGIAAIILELPVVDVNGGEFCVGVNTAVAETMRGGIYRGHAAREIGLHIVQRGIEVGGDCPIPEGIILLTGEERVAFRFGDVLARSGQDYLRLLINGPAQAVD